MIPPIGAAVLLRRFARPPGVRDVLFARAPQQKVLEIFGQLVPGRFEEHALREPELAFHRLGDAAIDVPLPATEVLPRPNELDRSLGERLLRRVTSRPGSKLKNSPSPSHSRHMPCGTVEAE